MTDLSTAIDNFTELKSSEVIVLEGDGTVATRTEIDERAFHQAVAELDDLAVSSGGGVEGLDRASCSPAVLYLAKIGIGAAARGCSGDGWRTEVAKSGGPESVRQLDHAEECMRGAGLWPWA